MKPSHVTSDAPFRSPSRVIYDTGSERLDLGPGDAVLFDIGDRHATDIPEGIVSLAINLIEVGREG